jgi:sortase A
MLKALHSLPWRFILPRLLILIGLGMIAYYYGTGVYTSGAQKELRRHWERQLAETAKKPVEKAPRPQAPAEGEVFGRLEIPKLGLDVIVLHGTEPATLTRGPGHITDTAWPGQGGNTAISGHRTTFGAPFRHLDRLRAGDKLIVSTADGRFVYKMTGSATVRPTDIEVIGQDHDGRLTLTTCDPPGSSAKRLAVWAEETR